MTKLTRYIQRTVLVLVLISGLLYLTKDKIYLGPGIQGRINRYIANQTEESAAKVAEARDWRCSNEVRLSHLKKMCDLHAGDIKYHHARVVQDKKHNLLFCEVSKAGCTTVKGMWIEANSRFKGDKSLNISEFEVRGELAHNKRLMGKAGIQLHKLNTWTNQFKNDTKFITVRHPYDRLVSAFYNLKYWKPGKGDALPYVTGHFKKRFQSILSGNLTRLTFEQFLTVVTDGTIRIYQDRHWKPYTESCYVCHIEYDYILKTETLYADLGQILKHIGHPDTQLLGVQMNAYKRDMDSTSDGGSALEVSRLSRRWTKHLPEFGQLSSEIKKMVAERFRNDMTMFGYHFDEKTNMAYCSYDDDFEDSGSCSNCC